MKFVRFMPAGKNDELKGILDNDVIRQIYGSYLQAFTVSDNVFTLDNIALLPPVLPQNIICVDSDGSASVRAPSSLAGSGTVLYYEQLYCTPRVAYVVKNRDHSKSTGVSLFGVSMMFDFSLSESYNISSSYNGFTTLGPCVDTDFSHGAFSFNHKSYGHLFDKHSAKLIELSKNISFRPGDVTAFALTGVEAVSGHVSLAWGAAELSVSVMPEKQG